MSSPIISFEECLRDSPYFRDAVESHQVHLDVLEVKLEKILKACNTMIASGKEFVNCQSQMVSSIYELSQHYRGEERVTTSLNKVANTQKEYLKFKSILLDQANRSVSRVLSNFINKDLKQVKDAKMMFDKISVEYDNALVKNASIPKTGASLNRLAEKVSPEDIQNMVMATRACFRHTALDYLYYLTIVQAKFKHDILDAILSFSHANSTFFHQGSDLCEDVDPFLKKLGTEISSMREETTNLEKLLDNRHIMVHNKDLVASESSKASRPSVLLEGYLFKKTSSKFKTWNRRWFIIRNNQLVYRKRNGSKEISVMEEDLRLCSVKPAADTDRRHCLEITSPSKSHTLQADSDESLIAWFAAFQQGIGLALQQPFQNGEESRRNGTDDFSGMLSRNPSKTSLGNTDSSRIGSIIMTAASKISGNDKCCDCGSPNPSWASINLGIVVCVDCCGIHRSLGVHFSKVRSLTLDSWEPEIMKVMKELGNEVVNKIYLEQVPEGTTQAAPGCSNLVRDEWIRSKYVQRKFVKRAPPNEPESPELADRGRIVRRWSVRKNRRRSKSKEPFKKSDEKTERSPAGDLHSKCAKRTAVIIQGPLLPEQPVDDVPGSPDERVVIVAIGDDLGPVTTIVDGVFDDENDDSTDGEDNISIGAESLSKFSPDILLYKAARAHNLPVMTWAIALGADKNWSNVEDYQRTPLHQAVVSGSAMACEFLFLNGARVNAQDSEGITPMRMAAELGHISQVGLLLKHRANQDLADNDGVTPLDIAMKLANADIVTLLRISKLNDEMRESESGGDATFQEVVREYSEITSDQSTSRLRSRLFPKF